MVTKSSVVNYSYPPNDRERIMNSGTDVKGDKINLHPDGQPWLKCCGCKEDKIGKNFNIQSIDFCAFRRNEPGNTARLAKENRPSFENCRFICVHQTTKDGHHRVCAGWHAIFGRHIKNET
jgi:hypothetical protein